MSRLTLFESIGDIFSSNHCILVVTTHKFPNFTNVGNYNERTVLPVIKHIPYVKDFNVSYNEFEEYINNIYKNEQVLLIPVKYHWVLRLIRYGNDYNQNYTRIHYLHDELHHTNVRTYREGLS
jgi:hypothetical protein